MAGEDGQIVTHEIPNPDYIELQELLADARRAASVHGHRLDRAAELMGSVRVWTGPSTATCFAAEVEGRKGTLPWRFEEFIEEIEHRMRQTPRTVEASTRVW